MVVDRGGKRIVKATPALFPYANKAFDKMVVESFKTIGAGSKKDFYAFMEQGLERTAGLSWRDWIDKQTARLEGSSDRAATEQEIADELHGLIKTIIPKFSLDRGFEFNYTVTKGERQCYLQSIIVGGLLQRVGMNCGIAMVWKNDKGQTSNNGHAVPVLKLSNGKDVIVDCSDPQPFMQHQGLFVRVPGRKADGFVQPLYEGHLIAGYHDMRTGQTLSPADTDTLGLRFIGSQFDYYRGERSQGSLVLGPTTREGLKKSLSYLKRSVHRDPYNPLAQYVLASTYWRLGDKAQGKKQFARAQDLYEHYGWVPPTAVNMFKKAGL